MFIYVCNTCTTWSVGFADENTIFRAFALLFICSLLPTDVKYCYYILIIWVKIFIYGIKYIMVPDAQIIFDQIKIICDVFYTVVAFNLNQPDLQYKIILHFTKTKVI